ncbi:hypothetical protein [Cetobacterium ceti]
MKIRLHILSVLFIFLSFISYGFDFGPMGFDKRIDDGSGYGEFSLRNHENHPIRYKISILDSGKKNNISKYASVYPKILTIPAQGEKFFKVYVDPKENIKPGEYSFIIGMKSVGIPFLGKGEIKNSKPEVTMQAGVNVEMSCYAGNIKNYFDIKNPQFYKKIEKNGMKKKYFKGKILNNTGRGYEIGVGFYDANNTLMEVKAKGRLSNKSSMDVNILIPNQAKKIVFYDYNNQIVVGQQITIK